MEMRSIRKFWASALIVFLALMGVVVTAPAAQARPTSNLDGPVWVPYRTPPFTTPAGLACSFTLRGEPVLDEELIATWSSFPDGSPRLQTIKGDLRVRYTNVESGASLEVDLNGVGTIRYGADGSQTFFLAGPAAVGFRPTDPYPAGFYVLDGFHVVYTASGRAFREMRVDAGTERNICDDLD